MQVRRVRDLNRVHAKPCDLVALTRRHLLSAQLREMGRQVCVRANEYQWLARLHVAISSNWAKDCGRVAAHAAKPAEQLREAQSVIVMQVREKDCSNCAVVDLSLPDSPDGARAAVNQESCAFVLNQNAGPSTIGGVVGTGSRTAERDFQGDLPKSLLVYLRSQPCGQPYSPRTLRIVFCLL